MLGEGEEGSSPGLNENFSSRDMKGHSKAEAQGRGFSEGGGASPKKGLRRLEEDLGTQLFPGH